MYSMRTDFIARIGEFSIAWCQPASLLRCHGLVCKPLQMETSVGSRLGNLPWTRSESLTDRSQEHCHVQSNTAHAAKAGIKEYIVLEVAVVNILHTSLKVIIRDSDARVHYPVLVNPFSRERLCLGGSALSILVRFHHHINTSSCWPLRVWHGKWRNVWFAPISRPWLSFSY
jgi:hypothetical protein